MGNVKLTLELSTVLAQVEACLNSRPLAPLPESDECVEALTPGIGRPLKALPESTDAYLASLSLLRRWKLYQAPYSSPVETMVNQVHSAPSTFH